MRSTPLALCLATTTLSFGSVTIGTPVSETLTLSSTGTAAVTVSAVKIAGAGFTVSGATFPVTLNPGIAVKLQVQFNPTAAGTVSGSVTISSNSSTGASTGVPLSATGVAAQHKVNLSWAAPVNSPVPVAGYEVYRALSGSTSFQLLNSTLDATTTYQDASVQSGSSYTYYVESVNSASTRSAPLGQTTVKIT